jgi:asparagine synthase (glutamine-hydrolysing)
LCGIAGFVGRFDERVLAKMGAALAHRGPDGGGTWVDATSEVGFVHRRLSIIDLSEAASQPMSSTCGRYQTVFNGEIYNFKEVATFLKEKGYELNMNSDTAVLAPLYDLEGPAMLERLEAMFAFAIWDARNKELFIARDHAGIKPLYYSVGAKGLAFASELKALEPLLEDRSLDAIAMAEYVSFLWTPGERTMFAGVRKLRPGHYLKVTAGEVPPKVEDVRWCRPPRAQLVEGLPVYDHTKTSARLLKVLDSVVAEQCTSDVPVGAFLSGGVDSSAVVASMVATGNRPAQTYCIGFAGEGMAAEGFEDDLRFAELVAKHLNVPFKALTVEMEPLLSRLPELAFVLDEPTADPAPLFVEDIAAEARRDGIKVLLSGSGGDDVFSGYRRHVAARWRQRLGPFSVLARKGAVTVGPLLGLAGKRRSERLAELLTGDDDNFLLKAFQTNSVPEAWKLLKCAHRRGMAHGFVNALTEARAESCGENLLNRLLYMELFGFLPDHNLNYTDKATMLTGVEGRVPLTDRRLLTYMADVAPAIKMGGGVVKWFFKKAVAPRLPRAVITRAKTGFGAPMTTWLRSGAGRKIMEGALLDSAFVKEWYDLAAVEALWRDTVSGRANGTYACLSVAMQAWWAERFCSTPGVATATSAACSQTMAAR